MLDDWTELAWALATDLLGPVQNVVHQPYGHAGLTFEVRADSGEYILKTKSVKGAFDHTERHIETLRKLNIKTPTVVRRGSFRDADYLLLHKIPGRDLGYVMAEMTRSQLSRLAAEVVRIERKVTGLPHGKGFGWTPMDVPGPFASWTEVIERDLQPAPLRVRDEVLRARKYFDAVEPVCFLDDLTVKNVLILDGEFQGIVDLDQVCFGDPLYWLSLAEVTSVLDVGLRAVFYGEELRRLWGMTAETSAVCDLYNVMQSWEFLGKGLGAGALETWSTSRHQRAHQALNLL